MTPKQALEKIKYIGLHHREYDDYYYDDSGIEVYDGTIEENYSEEIQAIEKDLERLEKLEKVIKILKYKIEFENLGEMQTGYVFRGYFNDCFDEDEYDLLKEVLL